MRRPTKTNTIGACGALLLSAAMTASAWGRFGRDGCDWNIWLQRGSLIVDWIGPGRGSCINGWEFQTFDGPRISALPSFEHNNGGNYIASIPLWPLTLACAAVALVG